MPISQEKLEEMSETYAGYDIEKILGGGLLTLTNKMSGPRGIMFITHIMQRVMLNKPEVPGMFTSWENAFGANADSFKKAESDKIIVAMIPRHTKFPAMKFLLVIKDVISGAYDVVEICHYENLSEGHGYMRPTSPVLNKFPGDVIRAGEYYYKSTSLDDNDNYRYGVNAKVAYLSRLDTTEDAVCVSKSFAERTTFYGIEELEVVINLNEILLNLYGDEDNYKCMPDIGDYVPDNGIIFRKRKVDFAKSSSSITNSSLMTPQNNDITYKGHGQIVDIDIFVNNRLELESDNNRKQLLEIYNDQLRYNREVCDVLGNIMNTKGSNYTDMLKHTYENARNYINNSNLESKTEYKYVSNNGIFEFAYLNIKIAKPTKLALGYKLTNRFAAKGVISKIVDDEYMPRDVDGNIADIVLSPPGIVGRANSGQLYEHELNYCAAKILDYMKNKLTSTYDRYALYIKFISMVNKEQADYVQEQWEKASPMEREEFIRDLVNSPRLHIKQPPFYGNTSLDELENIYDEFNIHPNYIRTRIEFEGVTRSDRYITQREYESKKNLYTNYITDDKKQEKNTVGIGDFIKYMINPKKYGKNIKEYNGELYFQTKESFGIGDIYRQEQRAPKLVNSIMDGLYMLKEMGEKLDRMQFLDPQPYLYINERGNLVRDIRSDEKVVIAEEYFMVLKQTPEAAFSACSLGNVSQTNIPTKGRNQNTPKAFSEPPIKKGEMEVANSLRMEDPEIVHRFMAERATNPEFRRKVSKMLLTEDPFEYHDIPMANEEIVNDMPARMFVEYIRVLGGDFIEAGQKDPNEILDKLPIEDINKYLKDTMGTKE